MLSLTTLRRSFSRNRLHRYKQMQSGVNTGSGYEGSANTADAQRIFVSSDLGSTSVTDGEEIRADYYDNWYLYLLNAVPEQRRVSMNGYSPNNEASTVTDYTDPAIVGYVMLERALSAIVSAETEAELHPTPVLDDDMPGIHSFLNQALGSMRMTHTISVTPNGTRRVQITSQPWLTKQSMLGQVIGPAADYVTAMDTSTISQCKLQLDGDKTYLILPYAVGTSSGTLFLDCYRPRNTWIKVSGTWATSTAGLVNETDECTGDEKEITLVAYYHYLTALLGRDPRGASPNVLREWKLTAEAAAPFLVYDQDAIVPVADPGAGYGMPDTPQWRAFRGQSFAGGYRGGRGGGGGGWP